MQPKIEQLRQIIQAQITGIDQQNTALTLLDEIERENKTTLSGYMLVRELSHDLRTPLNAILGFSEILLDQDISGELTEDQLEDVQDIQTSGQRLLALLNNLVNYAKIKTNTLQLAPQAISIQDTLEKWRDKFQKITEEHHSLFIMSDMPSDVKISTTESLFQAILDNILKAASLGAGEYQVSLTPEVRANWLEINITTQNYGIDVATWQEHYETGTVYQKFGGKNLALPYELCKLMGGTLQVFRESDTSIRYSVRFPVVED